MEILKSPVTCGVGEFLILKIQVTVSTPRSAVGVNAPAMLSAWGTWAGTQ